MFHYLQTNPSKIFTENTSAGMRKSEFKNSDGRQENKL